MHVTTRNGLGRGFVGIALAPLRWLKDPLGMLANVVERLLFQAFYQVQWFGYHSSMALNDIHLSREDETIEESTLSTVPRIYVCWHARLVGVALLLNFIERIYVMTMPHKGWGHEGMFQRNLRKALFQNLARKGFLFIEQSRDRIPGQVVREVSARLMEGRPVAMTADGARGGAFIAQTGSILAAARAGVELVPYSFSSTRKIRINAFWDNCMVPAPLGTVHIRLGTPLRFSADVSNDPAKLEAARQQLAEALNRVTLYGDDLAGIRREYRLQPPTTRLARVTQD